MMRSIIPLDDLDFSKLDVQTTDMALIGQIMQRALDIAQGRPLPFDVSDLIMKVMHVHTTCCPLHLWQWLASDTSDYADELAGIYVHFDAASGQFCNGFWPKFSVEKRPLQ